MNDAPHGLWTPNEDMNKRNLKIFVKSKYVYNTYLFTFIFQGGRVLVHGIEGLNRSAAVLMAFLMSMSNCLLEDAFVYMKSLRPHLMVRLRLCLKQIEYSFPGVTS